MARMYPEDIDDYEKATQGERKVFRFLKEAARPHGNFICWYEPSIGSLGKEPDFVLFGKSLGLLVLEVKDWSLSQITAYTPFEFTIRASGKIERKVNPDKQAKGYVQALLEKLKEVPELRSDLPPHEGELKIPIGRMVVFPNIQRGAYYDRGLQWLIPPERALFREDLEPAGEILCDLSGAKFQDRVSGAFPFPFRGVNQKALERLSFAIWPERTFQLPLREGKGKTRFQREVLALDHAQTRLALHLGRGHQIIKGPPGSGKTLVLINRCSHLYRFHPRVKRILLVCYNIALVSYLKRLLQDKGLGIGDSGVHVYHFYELCSEILGERIQFENEESEYYELVLQEVLARLGKKEGHLALFDAILVDEGQDFSNEMLKAVLLLLAPGGDLVIGLDSYQDLYKRKRSWKSLGINASGRTRHLQKVYRNTVEIFNFTQRFIGERPKSKRQLALVPDDFAFHGDPPALRRFKSQQELEDAVIQELKGCLSQEEFKRSEVAIVYDDKIYGADRFAYDNRALPMRIEKKLEASGIPATWVSRDLRSKELFDPTADRVSLVSIHSSKGLDFELVYLLGVDRIHPTNHTRNSLVSLVYVAMTRAKYRLFIPYVNETEFIARIKDCLVT